MLNMSVVRPRLAYTGLSPGLLVMEEGSCLRGCEFDNERIANSLCSPIPTLKAVNKK